MATFGKQLKEIRGARTQETFARLLKCTPSYISALEADKKTPSEEFIKTLADTESISKERRTELRQAAGYEPVVLDASLIALNALITDGVVSVDVRRRLTEDMHTIIECWQSYQQAKSQQYNRSWSQSLETSRSALDKLNALHGRLAAYLLDAQASVLIQQADFDKVHAAQKAAPLLLAHTEDKHVQALTHMHQGDYCREISEWEEAASHYKKAQRLFSSLGSDLEEARCAHKLAVILMYQGDWRKAQGLLESCKTRFKELASELEQIRLIYTFAWMSNTSGQRDQAHQYHAEGLRRSRLLQPEDDELIRTGAVGIAHDAFHRREIGEEFFSHIAEVEKRASKIGDRRALGFMHLLNARAYSLLAGQEQPNTDAADTLASQAEEYFKRSLSYLDKTHYRYRYAATLIFYAQHLLSRRKRESAKEALIDAIAIMRDLSSQYYLAFALTLMCRWHYQFGEYDAIESLTPEIESLHRRNTYADLMGQLRCIEARATLERGSIDTAASQLAESFGFGIAFHPQAVEGLLDELTEIVAGVRSQTRFSAPDRQRLRETFLAACETQINQLSNFGNQRQRWEATLPRIRVIVAPLKSQYQ